MGDVMTRNNEDERKALVREAADLWLRLQNAPHDHAIQEETQQWRTRSTAHERAFAAAENIWSLAGEAETLTSPALSASSRSKRKSHGHSIIRGQHSARKRVGALAGIAAVFALAIISLPSLTLMWQSDYRTGTGEKLQVALTDGSTVMLDTASAIAVDYKGNQRAIRLLAGRAWFDVTKDNQRPFTVSAAEARVTVTGTSFDVGFDEKAIDVTLAQGGVNVTWSGKEAGNNRPVHMIAGDNLHFNRSSHRILREESAVSSMGSWRRDRLLLENVTLSEGVAKLSRYHSGTIIIREPLASRRVTGVFDVRDPAEALRLMVRQHGAAVHEITPWILIVIKN